MRGKLSFEKVSPAPLSKNFAQGFVGEDIILPKECCLCAEKREIRETRGNLLSEKVSPNPFEELAERLWK